VARHIFKRSAQANCSAKPHFQVVREAIHSQTSELSNQQPGTQNQTGFVAGMSTHVNIILLVEQLRNSKRRQGDCCILIDYKSAYNTINRDLLYLILKYNEILTNDEVDLLIVI
jgi:hypothetical protein